MNSRIFSYILMYSTNSFEFGDNNYPLYAFLSQTSRVKLRYKCSTKPLREIGGGTEVHNPENIDILLANVFNSEGRVVDFQFSSILGDYGHKFADKLQRNNQIQHLRYFFPSNL